MKSYGTKITVIACVVAIALSFTKLSSWLSLVAAAFIVAGLVIASRERKASAG